MAAGTNGSNGSSGPNGPNGSDGRRMLIADHGDARFQVRVAAVVIDSTDGANGGGRVLLHRAEHEDFWSLPGGRAEILEASADCLRRELREEIGVEAQVGRLLWTVENFFHYSQRDYHELGLYYAATLPASSRAFSEGDRFLGHEPHCRLFYEWFPLSRLASTRVHPSFLKTALLSPPAATAHVVHRDGAL